VSVTYTIYKKKGMSEYSTLNLPYSSKL
jgi:hypothetical protein